MKDALEVGVSVWAGRGVGWTGAVLGSVLPWASHLAFLCLTSPSVKRGGGTSFPQRGSMKCLVIARCSDMAVMGAI